MREPVVLVVDDGGVATELSTAANAVGPSLTVRSVSTAAEAADVVSSTDVDCVVSERELRDGDGLALLGRLGSPDLTRVLLTDEGSEALASDAVVAGVDAYVPKGLGGAGSPDGREATDEAYDRVVRAIAAGVGRDGDEAPEPDGSRSKIETLHDVAMALESCTTEDEIYTVAVEAAELVLEFDMCNVDVREDGTLIPVETSSEMPPDGVETSPIDGESVAARVARTGASTYTEDLRDETDADPTQLTYRSGLTVPISDVGVFQAVSERVASFDQSDLELAETLMQHVAESVKRTRFRRTLRAERDRFAALFENVPDPVVRLTTTGTPTIEAVNAAFAETFDCDPDAVVDEPIDGVLVAPSTAGGSTVFPGVEAADAPTPTELRLAATDGARDFLVHVVPVGTTGDDGGPVAEVYGFYADITPTKERERELSRQNERLDEFASIASHDLRNPLNIAEGHLELARERADDGHLCEVAAAHERMRELIENLLSLARSGVVVDDLDRVSIPAAATDAWSSVHLPDATLEVTEDGAVRADSDRLRDLLVNLFRNAGEHGPPDVRVRTGVLEDGTGFYVADDGPGIPPGERESVFESGYTTRTGGTGFGLAIVEQVASAHDWSVRVTESREGGARFEFSTDEAMSTTATTTDEPACRE